MGGGNQAGEGLVPPFLCLVWLAAGPCDTVEPIQQLCGTVYVFSDLWFG
jgi:hypothetical protein